MVNCKIKWKNRYRSRANQSQPQSTVKNFNGLFPKRFYFRKRFIATMLNFGDGFYKLGF